MELKTLRVLVVDDTADSLDMLVELLRALGAQARGAPSADAGLKEDQGFAPHVILSDLEMPRKDGYGFLKDLRDSGVKTPVIAITGYATAHHAQRTQAAGFAAFLPKPATLSDVRDTILRVLASPAS